MNGSEAGSDEALEPIKPLPDWTPKSVEAAIRRIEKADLSAPQHAILRRLALDPQMEKVWVEFLKKDRKTGEFVHPALRERRPEIRSKAKLQNEALGEIFNLAFTAARDRMSVSRLQDVLKNEKLLRANVFMLEALANDLKLALTTGQLGITDPTDKAIAARDIVALVNVAGWLQHIIKALRKANDPLIVKRHRTDPIVKGVQTLVAQLLVDIFGKRLDRTAATLASVALNAKASASSARSALTRSSPKRSRPRPAS